MFRLPVCPYCKTVYSYKEVKKSIGKRKAECYHCKNAFKPNLTKKTVISGIVLLIVILVLNMIIIKILSGRNSSILPLYIVDLFFVIGFYFLLPFTAGFKKLKENEIKEIPTDSILPEKSKLKRSEKSRKRKEQLNTKR